MDQHGKDHLHNFIVFQEISKSSPSASGSKTDSKTTASPAIGFAAIFVILLIAGSLLGWLILRKAFKKHQ